jgi:hypothetical protein
MLLDMRPVIPAAATSSSFNMVILLLPIDDSTKYSVVSVSDYLGVRRLCCGRRFPRRHPGFWTLCNTQATKSNQNEYNRLENDLKRRRGERSETTSAGTVGAANLLQITRY